MKSCKKKSTLRWGERTFRQTDQVVQGLARFFYKGPNTLGFMGEAASVITLLCGTKLSTQKENKKNWCCFVPIQLYLHNEVIGWIWLLEWNFANPWASTRALMCEHTECVIRTRRRAAWLCRLGEKRYEI